MYKNKKLESFPCLKYSYLFHLNEIFIQYVIIDIKSKK